MVDDDAPWPPVLPPHVGEADWQLWVDGTPVPCGSLQLTSEVGYVTYGRHPRGYDTWWFRERNGGSGALLPVSRAPSGWLVGLVEEERPNMGGSRLCVLGGFRDAEESALCAAVREADEEVGLAVPVGEVVGLGAPVSPNRAFWIADRERGEGTALFVQAVDFRALVPAGPMRWTWVAQRAAEQRGLVFLPWREAVASTADALALSAIVRWIATLGEDVG